MKRVAPGLVVAILVVAVAHAKAPGDQYSLFTGSDPLIFDKFTLLTWQRRPPPDLKSQTDAIAYCSGLNASGFEGKTGWRVPTYKELMTLVDETIEHYYDLSLQTTVPKAIDLYAFPDTPSAEFWSSSGVPNGPLNGFFVDFSTGEGKSGSKATGRYVRCVTES